MNHSAMKKRLLILTICIFVLSMSTASALTVHVANSKDWQDVYSVMQYASSQGDKGAFANSESFIGLRQSIPLTATIQVYESDDPYLANLGDQLVSAGYQVDRVLEEDTFNTILDDEAGYSKYVVISEDNFRISASVASFAHKFGYWVFIAGEDNLDDIVDTISSADEVIGVGDFRRDLLSELSPLFTEHINNNNIYMDSQQIAERFGTLSTVVLTDGGFIEIEFFDTSNPVLISGYNKILDDTYNFLKEKNVASVVIIGNQLSVVGEQIRQKSEKTIGVLIKYGQTNSLEAGQVYALSMFPLPQLETGIRINRVVYDPAAKQIAAYYENIGNVGIYALSTISILNVIDEENEEKEELASSADEEAVYLGSGEILPILYTVDIPIDQITDATVAEFYTSYGLQPTQIDSFLTMTNKFGPPFTINVSVGELAKDTSELVLEDVTYYKGLKRVGVTVNNPSPETVHYNVKINDLIVNGLKETLFKADKVGSQKSKTSYLSVELDTVDLVENEDFNVVLVYGSDEESMIKVLRDTPEFKSKTGISPLLIGGIVAVVVFIIIIIIVLMKGKKDSF